MVSLGDQIYSPVLVVYYCAQKKVTAQKDPETTVLKSKLSTQADLVCQHECYEIGLSYHALDDPRWCDDRYLNKSCSNSLCKHMFVSNAKVLINAGMKAYKPSTKRPLYECLNGRECKHAFCIDCWNVNSKKGEKETGATRARRSTRTRLT